MDIQKMEIPSTLSVKYLPVQQLIKTEIVKKTILPQQKQRVYYKNRDSDDPLLLPKEEVENKVSARDENISLLFPKNTKSAVWANFRIIVYKGRKQNYVECLGCSRVLAYKSKTGTASLLRHKCTSNPKSYSHQRTSRVVTKKEQTITFKNEILDPKEEAADIITTMIQKKPTDAASLSTMWLDGFEAIKAEQTDVINSSSEKMDVDDLSFISENKNNSDLEETMIQFCNPQDVHNFYESKLTKLELEQRFKSHDPNIIMADPQKSKNEIWTRFKLIYYNGIRQDFAKCLGCDSVLSYKKRTGTASLLRHRCNKRPDINNLLRNLQIPNNPISINNTTQEAANNLNCGNSEAENSNFVPEPPSIYALTEFIGFLRNLMTTTQSLSILQSQQYNLNQKIIPNDRLTELAKSQLKLMYNDLRPIGIFDEPSFKELCQCLVNLGADYGKQNIEELLTNPFILLQAAHKEVKSKILLENDFEKDFVALAPELWQSDQKFYVSLTTYSIDLNFNLKRAFLGTKEIPNEQNPTQILSAIASILGDFVDDAPLILKQSALVIADDDFLLQKTFKGNIIIPCMCFNLNLIIRKILDNDCVMKLRKDKLITNTETTVEEIIDELENITKKRNEEADDYKNNIQLLLNLLEPFRQCLESLTVDTHARLNEVYLWKKKLEKQCVVVADDNELIIACKIKASNLLEEYFVINDCHKMAVFLDPNFKSLKFLSEHERANVMQVVRTQMSHIMARIDKQLKDIDLSMKKKSTEAIHINQFLEFMDCPVSGNREDAADLAIRRYMDQRLAEPIGVLHFWRNDTEHQHLRLLARRILNIPACSIQSRMLMSSDGIHFKAKRQLLPSSDVKDLLFVNQNY